ncbi:AAA family ATPase [Candidatus Pacearchaeota archaeon]|nr:AAA family ATPase [Candidatus Pacearchaeota archaeon]
MGKVIGILSLKGGVGKTTSTISLGAALASLGKKVLLVDANFSAPNLGTHLNIIEPEKTIHHVLTDDVDIHDAIYEYEDFEIIPASIYPKKQFDPLKLKDRVRRLKHRYDFILIDSSPSLNNETLATMITSDELFVVSTPDIPTLTMTIKAIAIAKKRGTPISGIIINKVYKKNFELSIENIEKTSEVPVLAMIPHDVNVLRAQAQFIPSTYFKPNSDASIEYKKLASCLVGEKYNEPFRIKEIFHSISPKRQDVNRELFYHSVF